MIGPTLDKPGSLEGRMIRWASTKTMRVVLTLFQLNYWKIFFTLSLQISLCFEFFLWIMFVFAMFSVLHVIRVKHMNMHISIMSTWFNYRENRVYFGCITIILIVFILFGGDR